MGRVPLFTASVVTALVTYFLGCQVLLCRAGSHGDNFPYCRNTPTARLSWWRLRLCLETPSHPRTLCCRLPAERESSPASPARRLAPQLRNAEQPRCRTARPVRVSRNADRRTRSSPQRMLQGRALPAGSVSRTPRRRQEAQNGWRAMDGDLAFPAPPGTLQPHTGPEWLGDLGEHQLVPPVHALDAISP